MTGDDVVQKIIDLLLDNKITFQLWEHEPTPSSEDSAKVRGMRMEEGRKAMILKGRKSGNRIMIVIPSNLKIDMKKVKAKLGEEFQFEDPEVIFKDFGVKIGGVPPLGNIFGLETYFDNDTRLEKRSAFNCGLQTKSIIMDTDDLIKVVNPIFVDLKKQL